MNKKNSKLKIKLKKENRNYFLKKKLNATKNIKNKIK